MPAYCSIAIGRGGGGGGVGGGVGGRLVRTSKTRAMSTKHSDDDWDDDDEKSNGREEHGDVDGGTVSLTDTRRYSTEHKHTDIMQCSLYTLLYELDILGVTFFLSNLVSRP